MHIYCALAGIHLRYDVCDYRFVELVEELARQGKLAQLGITPVLFAAASTPYATALIARVQAAAPEAVMLSNFMGPAELAKVHCCCGSW